MGKSAHVAGMDAHDVVVVDFVVADPTQQRAQGHPGFHPGQVSPQTEVGTAAETD